MHPKNGVKKLALFDVDGTLVHSGGAGKQALTRAFSELHGLSGAMEGITFAGLTDPAIVRDIFRVKLGRESVSSEDVARVLGCYEELLAEEVWKVPGAAVCPGVQDVLDALARCPEIAMGLLTGNIEAGARLKLGRFDLHGYFAFGAFGSDSEDRSVLASLAAERGRAHTGATVEGKDLFIIGDTPRDIACGRHLGVTSVAVATGPFAIDELASHDPDHLLPTLEGGRLVEVLTGS